MRVALIGLGMLLGAVACSNSDDKGGGVCTISEGDPVFTSVSKASGSDAACPTLSASDLNGGGDGGPSSCGYISDGQACTLDIDCSDSDTRSTGSFEITEATFSGEISVTLTAGGLTCKYTVSGTA